MDRGLVNHRRELQRTEEALPATQFESIVAAYEAPISRYLYNMVGDLELARDLAQETFLSAYRAYETTEITNLSGWLYRIATNHALSHFRRKRLVHWVSLSRLLDRGLDPGIEGHSERVVMSHAVEAALAELDPRDRACLLLKAAGFSSAEIAEQLDCSPGAARTRLFRAREAFRQIYHRDDPDFEESPETQDEAEGR
ncbi:MAG TPA: RNA polymerase sigma factor, partial [Thermomicrobiaceae bacterium]|nr:RNA polymerase sigma factor [Thermomicrobiaceae bacterium]